MNIKFDKVYCISYCRNIEKQNRIRKIMNLLGIDFEFIYGADYSNLNILKLDEFNLPGASLDKSNFNHYTHFLGASYDHYTAVIHAYESGANSVLIMEDDCAFINDINYIKTYLNNYPKDADIVKYGFYSSDNFTYNKDNKGYYTNKNGQYAGAQLYGICNRETMKHYIKFQQETFVCCDIVFGKLNQLYDTNIYTLINPLALDSFILEIEKTENKKYYNLFENI